MPSRKPSKNETLHGSAPDRCPVALLLVDVINDFEFEVGQELLKSALPAAKKIAKLKASLKKNKIPVIYANDNFGRWQSDFRGLVDHCMKEDIRGKAIAKLLRPEPDDYFVLKPKHSAFFSTTLETLLTYLGVERLMVAGFASHQCVMFTANDAHMRDYEIIVPEDTMAAGRETDHAYAVYHFEHTLRADISPATKWLEVKNLRKLLE